MDAAELTRRRLLQAAAGLLGLTAPSAWPRRLNAQPRFSDNPFTLGIASGDPSPTSVVLWTRLAPRPLEGGGMPREDVELRCRVATDDRMANVVVDEIFVAMPELAHSVHAIVNGLEPSKDYWYQFSAGGEETPIGRTRTLAQPGARISRVDFAYTSCQHYESGFYAPYRFMAEEDLDLVIQLGDYIYEGGISALAEGRIVRQHNSDQVISLHEYRNRYALYKSDPDLQAAHAAFPWLVSWDDHEVNNNYASSTPQDPDKQTAAEFFVRRLAATQAYYEHMPLRNFPVPKGGGLDLRLYGRTTFGDLAQVHLLDTRQYRSDQVCPRGDYVSPDCADRHAPSRTMLGEQQEAWLLNGLERSEATWNVVAQQVWFGQYRFTTGAEPEFNRDAWDGYPVQRQRIVDLAAAKRASNPVVLSGDWHNSCVRDIHRNPDDPTSEVVMTEFAGTSLSSRTGRTSQIQASLADNPHVKFFDGDHRGYVRCRIEPEIFRADLQFLSNPFDATSETMRTGASFIVESGRPGAQKS